MGTQQESRPETESNINYNSKARLALGFARDRAHRDDRKLVTFKHLVEGINSQIPPQEKSGIYITYGINELDLKLNTIQTITAEYLDFALIEKAHTYTETQFSPRVQRAIQYAEELAASKQNQTLDVNDLFRGAVKVTDDEHEAQQLLIPTL